MQKERRQEVKMRRKLELKEIMENASLLREMLAELEQSTINGLHNETHEDTLATLKCLYDSCQRFQPTISIILGDIEENECLGMPIHSNHCFCNKCNSPHLFHLFNCLGEAVDVNELLTDVFKKYHELITNKSSSTCLITPHPTNILNSSATTRSNGSQNTMDELNEIFAASNEQATSKPTMDFTPSKPSTLLINYKPDSNGMHLFQFPPYLTLIQFSLKISGSNDEMWQMFADSLEQSTATISPSQSTASKIDDLLNNSGK